MARAAVIPQSPAKQGTRGKKGTTTKGATGTASATARNAARDELSTGGRNSATSKTRGRVTKTQVSTGTMEPKTRTTRSKATSRKDNKADSDDEGTDDDDEIELISSKTQSNPPRGRKAPSSISSSSSSSSSSKATGRGKRNATPAATDTATDTETDDDELAQADAAPKKKQAGRPKTKKPASATVSLDAGTKPTRGRPKTTASKSTSSATGESGKGVTTRKQTRSQTTAHTESPSEMDPKQVVITTGSSAAVKSNMLRGPAKKKKVTFHDVSDSEKENMSSAESQPAGRRTTSTSTTTRRTGLNAKPSRNTTASSGRGRKSASSTTSKESPKPLSPKKTTQVAKSLSSYASSDGEDDELNCGKNQDPSPVKHVVESSPTKHGSEYNVGLGSPVKKVNLIRTDENDVFAHLAATGPRPEIPAGLSSPVRKINFTPNKQPPKSCDEDGEHSSRKINFKDSAFMSSPAKRPARSPFQYKIKESPRKCHIAINDTSKPVSNQPPDFTPKHGSPLKSSPKKADLSTSLSQTPLNSFPSSTPFSARIRLFQSPAKRFPSPFPFKGSTSPRRLFGSKSVEKNGDADLNSSVCGAGPEESSQRVESRKDSNHVADNGAKLVDSQDDSDAELGSEPENEAGGRSEVPVEKVVTEEDEVPERLEQRMIEENDLDMLKTNEGSQDGQDKVEREACEGATEDLHAHSIIDNGQDDVQEQDEESGPIGDAQTRLDTSDAHVREEHQEQEDQEHGHEEPLRLSGDEEDVQANSEVEDVQNISEVPPEPVDQNMGDADSEGNGSEVQEVQIPGNQQRESVRNFDDVFVDGPADEMAEPPETPAGRRQGDFSGSRNEPDDENDSLSEGGDFDFDDEPTLVASTGNDRYMVTPRHISPYEINENEYDGMSSIQRIRSIPPPAPSPPISDANMPFSFRHRQESGGNIESDAEEFGSEAGSAMEERNNKGQLNRSGSRISLGRKTSGDKSTMEERRATLRQEGLRLTPLAQQFSQWNSGNLEEAQSRRPRRRGIFSLGKSQRPTSGSSRRSSRFSQASSRMTRQSMAGTESPLRELSVREVTPAEPVSSVQKSETIQNDTSRDQRSISMDHDNEEAESREALLEESLSQQVDKVLNDLEPRRKHSTNNAEVYCDEDGSEEDPATRNEEASYPDLPVVEEDFDDNKENEESNTPASAKADVPSYPVLAPESGGSNENKEDHDHDNALVLHPEPVTPSRNKNNDLLHASHTVSKVPLKPEGQVSPLKISRKRGRSLSDTSPSRSSPRQRNRVLFPPPKSLTKSSSPSPRKLMRLEEPSERVSVFRDPERTQDENVSITMNSPAKTPRQKFSESQQVLRGAVVFVDVHTTEGEDASGIFVELLQQMGAKCVRSWNWNPRLSISPPVDGADAKDNKIGITHIVYKDGGVRTLEKVRQAGGLVKCVGVGWVLDCERDNKWLDENDYAVDCSIIPRGGAKRRKSMEPQSLSNVNGTLVRTPARGRHSGLTDNRGRLESLTTTTKPETPESRCQWDSQDEDRINTPSRMFPTTPGGKDYDFSRLDDIGMSPATPYFLSSAAQRSKLVQQTCPPKQTCRGLFEDYYRMKGGVEEGANGEDGGTVLFGDEDGDSFGNLRLRARLEASRRKSLAFKPKVGSSLAL